MRRWVYIEDDEMDEYGPYSLVGQDGNAFSLIGYVKNCCLKEQLPWAFRETLGQKATHVGDYYALVAYLDSIVEKLNEKYLREHNR